MKLEAENIIILILGPWTKHDENSFNRPNAYARPFITTSMLGLGYWVYLDNNSSTDFCINKGFGGGRYSSLQEAQAHVDKILLASGYRLIDDQEGFNKLRILL